MTPIWPPAMNAGYAGPAFVPWAVFVLGLGELVPALIHGFAPDGGAFSIAGLNPAAGRDTIIGIFAWAGATQLAWAVVILAVCLRYRVFIGPMLLMMAGEKAVIALNGWVLKAGNSAHHPPGLYGAALAVPVLLALFFISRRTA